MNFLIVCAKLIRLPKTVFCGGAFLLSLLLLSNPCDAQPTAPTGATTAAPADDAALTPRERQMMDLIRKLEARITTMEAQVGASSKGVGAVEAVAGGPTVAPAATAVVGAAEPKVKEVGEATTIPVVAAVKPPESAIPAPASAPVPGLGDKWGTYTPGYGFKVAKTDYGDMSLSIWGYFRYINQLGLKPTNTDSFGTVKNVIQRQDFQLQKIMLKSLGWVMTPKLRYVFYVWTANTLLGQGAQVVVAGNLGYTFNKYFTIYAGVNGLPGTRTLEGSFPNWLAVDSRLITEEFFRPSFTSGIWAKGQLAKTLQYQAMLGNNLSQLGIQAIQLNRYPVTFASALIWTPTTGEFGPGIGDFEDHQKVATRLAGHYTRSREDRQSQPNTEAIENTQLRISDGNVIFAPNLFGKGISITEANYQMTAIDGGVKYKGFSLDGTYYTRWIGQFKGTGTAVLNRLVDKGVQSEASMMLLPKTFQAYAGGSKIFGQYGNPWDVRTGVNFFPFKNRVVRWNGELLYLHKSPVGFSSAPFALGGKGLVFHTSVELAF